MSQRLSSKCLSKEGEWCCLWGNVSLYKQCISIQVADYDTLGRSWSDLIWRVRERLIRRRNSSMAQSTIDGREHNGCEDSTIFQARLPAESAKCCKRCVWVFLGLDGQGSIDWLRQYLVHQDCKIHDNTMKQGYCIPCQVQTFKVNAWMIHGSVDCMASLIMKSKNTEIHTDAKLKCFEGNFPTLFKRHSCSPCLTVVLLFKTSRGCALLCT